MKVSIYRIYVRFELDGVGKFKKCIFAGILVRGWPCFFYPGFESKALVGEGDITVSFGDSAVVGRRGSITQGYILLYFIIIIII